MKKISHSYYVVMIDHGQRGLEAVVHPENTRRKVVEMIASGELPSDQIAFIHHVDGLYVEDVAHEIVSEALAMKAEADAETAAIDRINARIAFNRDHAYDLRKHGETV